MTEGMTVEDLILLAGGFQEYAIQESAIVSRPKFDVEKGTISESFYVDLNLEYLLGNTKRNDSSAFYLEHRDVVNIRLISGYEGMKSIAVSGEVLFPGVVTLSNKKESLGEALSSVGGLTPFASLKSSYILRGNELFIINMNKALRKNVSFLKNGDKIVIGDNSGTVSVYGSVLNEGLFVWERGKRIKNYIRNSGSYDGKIDQVIVKYANGVTRKKMWYSNPKVMPNSEIFVYAKPEKQKNKSSDGMDKFIQVLTIITGTLTTIVLTRAL